MLMDYHIIFMVMVFILFIISIFLLFVDTNFEKAVAAFILIFLNFILCAVVSLGFGAIDVYGYDSSGNLVTNVYSDMYYFIIVFWVLGYINIMLLFYCVYIFYRKPWEDYKNHRGDYEIQEQYWDSGF